MLLVKYKYMFKFNKKISVAAFLGLMFFPSVVFAAANIGTIIGLIGNFISLLIPIVAALALLYFFWGLAKFILAAGNESAKAEGKQIMVWGIIALFVMMSVWGLVKTLQMTFSVSDSTAIPPPQIKPL